VLGYREYIGRIVKRNKIKKKILLNTSDTNVNAEPSSGLKGGFKATQVLKIIPEYHGRPNENVHEIIDAIEEGLNLLSAEEEKILLAFIRTKLKGAAFKSVQYLNITSWTQLKDHLQRRFGVGDSIRYI
jgi:hypothetical protein